MTSSRSLIERLERKARRSIVQVRGQRVLAILGMHRSGTSSLAGSLEQAGLYLGGHDVAGRGKWNAKGNRESKVLMQLHEDVLRASGGSWDDPPEHVAWSTEHEGVRDRFIRSRSTQRHWGFKDPRTILVVDGWLTAIPDLEMVATIRHPVSVARSLQTRATGGPAEDDALGPWLRLWGIYNDRLLQLHAAHGFPIIDFDLPADVYQARLASLMGELGLRSPSADRPFFESSLRTAELPNVQLPAEIDVTYRRLSEIATAQAGIPATV